MRVANLDLLIERHRARELSTVQFVWTQWGMDLVLSISHSITILNIEERQILSHLHLRCFSGCLPDQILVIRIIRGLVLQ